MTRTAEIHEVSDRVKHACWVGKPLWIATVYESPGQYSDRRIIDSTECGSEAEAVSWLRREYYLAPKRIDRLEQRS